MAHALLIFLQLVITWTCVHDCQKICLSCNCGQYVTIHSMSSLCLFYKWPSMTLIFWIGKNDMKAITTRKKIQSSLWSYIFQLTCSLYLTSYFMNYFIMSLFYKQQIKNLKWYIFYMWVSYFIFVCKMLLNIH